MYRSPCSPPLGPASPSPETLNLVPSSTPAGMSMSIFLVASTVPEPLHSLQDLFMYWPELLHFLQGAVVENIPKGVLLVCFT